MKTKESTPAKFTPDPAKSFRLAFAAKEKHSFKLYSIAWSSDIFSSPVASAESTQSGHFRYFAVCGGRFLTLYEVEVNNGRNEGRQMADSGFHARQAYKDADLNEDYYCCVFGGRGVGSPVGYGPIKENGDIIIDSTSLRDENQTQDNIPHVHTSPMSDLFDIVKNNGPQLLIVAGRSFELPF